MARYVPNVVLETEFTRPTSIWAVAVLGTDRLLCVDVPRRGLYQSNQREAGRPRLSIGR